MSLLLCPVAPKGHIKTQFSLHFRLQKINLILNVQIATASLCGFKYVSRSYEQLHYLQSTLKEIASQDQEGSPLLQVGHQCFPSLAERDSHCLIHQTLSFLLSCCFIYLLQQSPHTSFIFLLD